MGAVSDLKKPLVWGSGIRLPEAMRFFCFWVDRVLVTMLIQDIYGKLLSPILRFMKFLLFPIRFRKGKNWHIDKMKPLNMFHTSLCHANVQNPQFESQPFQSRTQTSAAFLAPSPTAPMNYWKLFTKLDFTLHLQIRLLFNLGRGPLGPDVYVLLDATRGFSTSFYHPKIGLVDFWVGGPSFTIHGSW